MTAPMDLTEDEQDIVDNAALAMESFERHNAPGNKQCQCHPCRSFDPNKSVVIADFAKKLSDARAALLGLLDNCSLAYDNPLLLKAWAEARAILATPTPVAVPADDRIYPCRECGVMRSKAEGGTTFTVCDECWDKARPKAAAPDPVQAPRLTFGARPPAAFTHEVGMSASEIVTSRAVQAAYAECARIVDQLYEDSDDGRISRSELVAEIEAAALRAGKP